jgi:hypothetical protein
MNPHNYGHRQEINKHENPGIPNTYFKDWYSSHDLRPFRDIPRQHMRWRLSVFPGEFIVNRHLVTGSEEYHLTGQANSNAERDNIITYARPWR